MSHPHHEHHAHGHAAAEKSGGGGDDHAGRDAHVHHTAKPDRVEFGKHAGDAGADTRAAHGGHDTNAGHDKHAGHSVAMFRDKFWLSLLLTMPTLVWGHMLQRAFGYTAPTFTGAHWIPPIFGAAVFLYGGRPFIQGAVRELRARLPGMMTLIALAISVAFVFSIVVTVGFPGMSLRRS
jgi:Cu2+-exporting ATPase